MKIIEFPEIKDTCTEIIEDKVLKMAEEGFILYSLFKKLSKWKEQYTFQYDEKKAIYWINELKGISFKSVQEAELYAFLDYCDKEGTNLYFLIGKNFQKD